MKTFVIGTFFALALLASGAPSVKAQTPHALCFTQVDCPDDTVCKDIGQYAGGRGICKNSAEQPGIFDNPLKAKSLMELFTELLHLVVRIAGIFLVLAFVFIGFQFAAAQGNAESIGKARQNLLWTVIGAAILLGAEGIAAVIEATGRSLAP